MPQNVSSCTQEKKEVKFLLELVKKVRRVLIKALQISNSNSVFYSLSIPLFKKIWLKDIQESQESRFLSLKKGPGGGFYQNVLLFCPRNESYLVMVGDLTIATQLVEDHCLSES